jgi:hypothetical protein
MHMYIHTYAQYKGKQRKFLTQNFESFLSSVLKINDRYSYLIQYTLTPLSGKIEFLEILVPISMPDAIYAISRQT